MRAMPGNPLALSPGDLVLNCPHLVDAIVDYASPRTRVSLLRTAKCFFLPCAKKIYHSIRIGASERPSFFEGIDKAIAELDTTACSQYGVSRRNPSLSIYSKRNLLGFTRIITVDGLHWQWCELEHDGTLARLFPNVEVVRFAPAEDRRAHRRRTNPQHFGTETGCHTRCQFAELPCRKMVFRNLSTSGFPFSASAPPEFSAAITELVFFLPPSGWIFQGNRAMYPVSRIAHFLTRPVKIVLWPQMEDSSQYLLSPLQGLAEHNHRRHPLDGRLLEEMEFLASVTQRHLTIFGMDRSLWKVTVHGHLVLGVYAAVEEDNRAAEERITRARESQFTRPLIKFKTLDQYVQEEEARFGEIDDENVAYVDDVACDDDEVFGDFEVEYE